jgi:hypothetical protein
LLVVIDSLHSWVDGAGSDTPEYEALNAGLVSLRMLSTELDSPVLVVAERNRAGMAKGGLSAGAGTRKIEYGASLVLDLAREEDAREDREGDIEVTLTVVKNRAGAAGRKLPLRFNGAYQRFRGS